ncbi:unnamed protein product, partial [Mesorhabditis spiculigera]
MTQPHYRNSAIMLEFERQRSARDSANWELDALIEELNALETDLASSKGDQLLLGIPTISPSNSDDRIKHNGHLPPVQPRPVVHPVRVEVAEQRNRVTAGPPSSCSSPDGDSAYGEGSSTNSHHRFHGSNVSSADSCRDSLNTPSPTQVSPHQHLATEQNLSPEELKAQKIREALEKIKKANITRIFVKFFVEVGQPLQLLVDDGWTVAETMRQISLKHNMILHEDHCIVEEFPDLRIKRIYEDHENMVENIQLWVHESPNKLWFVRRSDKYPFVDRPENYLVTERTKDLMNVPAGESWPREVKHNFVAEFFSRTPVIPPQLEGQLLVKADGRKSWKKQFLVLRNSGLYQSPKGKKSSKDMECLMNFHSYQVYSGFDWKKKYKAPTEWCICIKLTALQIKRSSYIKYLCCEDEATYRRWVTALRIAKNGADIYQNWVSAVAYRKQEEKKLNDREMVRAESSISSSTRGTSSPQFYNNASSPQHKVQVIQRQPSPCVSIQPSTSISATSSAAPTPTPERASRSMFDNDDLTGTIKRAPEHLLRRAPSQSTPSTGSPADDEVDSDEDSFPAPPPTISATYGTIQKRASTQMQPDSRPSSFTAIPTPVTPPKSMGPPPVAEKPAPPARTTPVLATATTPLAKKAPPPPPKRSETTRVQSVAPPTPHLSELEAALGRRRERVEGL